MAAFPPGWEKKLVDEATRAVGKIVGTNYVRALNPDGTPLTVAPPKVTWTQTHPPRTCAKCSSEEVTVWHVEGTSDQVILKDHLKCKCKSCGWQWSTPCDDADHVVDANKKVNEGVEDFAPCSVDLSGLASDLGMLSENKKKLFAVTFKRSSTTVLDADTVSGIYSQLEIDRYLEANPDYCMIIKDSAITPHEAQSFISVNERCTNPEHKRVITEILDAHSEAMRLAGEKVKAK